MIAGTIHLRFTGGVRGGEAAFGELVNGCPLAANDPEIQDAPGVVNLGGWGKW